MVLVMVGVLGAAFSVAASLLRCSPLSSLSSSHSSPPTPPCVKVTSVAYSTDGRLAVTYTTHLAGDSGSSGSAADQTTVTALAEGVVFASGGFAAGREMLAHYRPDVAALPTTNGPWATGDGVRLAGELGARLVHMDQVQVHPTGFIDPHDPDSGSKVRAVRWRCGWGVL